MKRNVAIDIVKGFCLLLVYIGHSGINCGIIAKFWGTFFMSAFFCFLAFYSNIKMALRKLLFIK